jgi:hypothetical protein
MGGIFALSRYVSDDFYSPKQARSEEVAENPKNWDLNNPNFYSLNIDMLPIQWVKKRVHLRKGGV